MSTRRKLVVVLSALVLLAVAWFAFSLVFVGDVGFD